MQLKRILVSLLVAIMVLSTAVVVSAEDVLLSAPATLDIAVESDSTADVAAGDTVEVNVVIKNNPGVRCVLFTLKWTANVTPVTGADNKVAVTTSDIFSFEDSVLGNNGVMVGTDNIKFVSDMGNSENVTATGTIVTLSFKVNDNYKCTDGDIVISLEGATALDAANNGYAASVTNLELSAHNYTEVAEVAATCTAAGSTAGKKCADCGTVVGVEEIPATGHNFADVAEVPATCTTAGTAAGKKCADCDATEGLAQIPALGHTEEAYGENGDGIKCAVCGEIIKEATVPTANLTWLWIVIAVVVVVAAAAVVYFVVIKKKK